MTKRYLRFNRSKQQTSLDNDDMVQEMEKNTSKLEIDSPASKYGSKMESRSTSNMYGNKDMCNDPETEEATEAFKSMKKIWKKAVFSIKKDTKPKAGLNYPKPLEDEPTPQREVSKSSRNSDVDPIYLMLRKAAHKPSDDVTTEDSQAVKKDSIEHGRMEKEFTRRESTSKTLSDDDMRKVKESASASKTNNRRRIDQRMKSFSVDNPEIEINCCSNDDDHDSIYEQSKKFSSSFTNTSAIEIAVTAHPLRKKYMKEQDRSISVENESLAITTTTGYDSYRSSCSIKSNEFLSPRQSTRYVNSVPDDARYSSPSSNSKVNLRGNRGNWKMKSFSMDVPDGDLEMSSGSSQLAFKATSHTSSPIVERSAYYKTSESPGHDSRSSHSNIYPSKRTARPLNTAQNMPEYAVNNSQLRSSSSRTDSGYENSQVDNRRLLGNAYVVLFDFNARRSDELDLKAGWRVHVLNCTDPDWWTGKCNGRIGYFPSSYVQKVQHGECVWKIVRDICLGDDEGNTFKLHKGEIVVQQGSQDGESIPLSIKKISSVWCPIDYIGKIFDDYI